MGHHARRRGLMCESGTLFLMVGGESRGGFQRRRKPRGRNEESERENGKGSKFHLVSARAIGSRRKCPGEKLRLNDA